MTEKTKKVLHHLNRAGGALASAAKEAGPGDLREFLGQVLELLAVTVLTLMATDAVSGATGKPAAADTPWQGVQKGPVEA